MTTNDRDLDRDAQPLNPWFNSERRAERDVSEMLGLAKGILADGVVTESEVQLLYDWTIAHPEAVEGWPGDILWRRLCQIFDDGVVDDDEREDLAGLLHELVGGDTGIVVGETTSTALPLDMPPPPIEFDGTLFVFTGKFAFGPREACEREVVQLGAAATKTITMKTDYLVIGTFASRDWAHTSYGRKIEKAVSYQKKGRHVAIVGEDHWAGAIG